MDLKLLRAFIQLAATEHYGSAATRLNMTQSTLSKQIRKLEILVGGEVFERGRHGAKLTPFGEILRLDATRLISHAEEIQSKLDRSRLGFSGHLRIGFGISTIQLAPQLISEFRIRHPDCSVELNDLATDEQHSSIREEALDLGFCRRPSGENLCFLPLFEEHLALVTPKSMSDQTADLERLNGIGFISLSRQRGAGLATQISQWGEDIGFQPKVVQYADDILTVHSAVAAGLGVAILPLTGASALANRTNQYRLPGSHSTWQVGLCWQESSKTPLVQNFVSFVAENQNPT